MEWNTCFLNSDKTLWFQTIQIRILLSGATQALADNRGELNNHDYILLHKKMSIQICKNVTESSWSNGIAEQPNNI